MFKEYLYLLTQSIPPQIWEHQYEMWGHLPRPKLYQSWMWRSSPCLQQDENKFSVFFVLIPLGSFEVSLNFQMSLLLFDFQFIITISLVQSSSWLVSDYVRVAGTVFPSPPAVRHYHAFTRCQLLSKRILHHLSSPILKQPNLEVNNLISNQVSEVFWNKLFTYNWHKRVFGRFRKLPAPKLHKTETDSVYLSWVYLE